MSESFVLKFTHIKDKPNSAQALPLLQKIASLVKPIMRKHNWKLPVLAEFFPKNERLVGLNLNSGQKIMLRLRPPNEPNNFYDEEQLVAVMLHELTHNVHGPHDEKFYGFLSKLEAEYDGIKRSGYAGEGFHSKGDRVGLGVSHNLPPHLARAKAIAAAEKRKATQEILGNDGSRRLGGRRLDDYKSLSPRELAAQAAERRARDNISCATTHGSGVLEEVRKAAEESIEDKAEDLRPADECSSPADHQPCGVSASKDFEEKQKEAAAGNEWSCPICTLRNPESEVQCLACLSNRPQTASVTLDEVHKTEISSSSQRARRRENISKRKLPSSPPVSVVKRPKNNVETGWTCETCTLHNEERILQCGACLATRPQARSMFGWSCMTCGEGEMPHEFWSCRFCGAVKQSYSAP